MSATMHYDEITEWAKAYTGPRFHAVMCDPPYELGFMGRKWDSSGVAFSADTWAAIASVCKPGAMLLAFGGTRTFHRIAVAIEDAGWEIRDTLMWVYGQGFPKSHDVSKAIDREAGAEREKVRTKITKHSTAGKGLSNEIDDRPWLTEARIKGYHEHASNKPVTQNASNWYGYGTALKPSYEPIIVARLPLDGTVAHNAQTHGTGALAVDACRVGADDGRPFIVSKSEPTQNTYGNGLNGSRYAGTTTLGRWPANLIHDGSDEVLTLFPETVGKVGMTQHASGTNGVYGKFARSGQSLVVDGVTDSGSAARFFYCAKASTSERSAGLENGNTHPTVKPLALTQYLARLILPPELDEPRRLLVPFAGSGSEVIGAMRAGWDEVEGVELEHSHVEIARARIAHWEN